MIAELANRGMTRRQVYDALKPLVTAQTLVFKANVNGRRIPKPMSEQYEMLHHEIHRVFRILDPTISTQHSEDQDRSISEPISSPISSDEPDEDEPDEDEDEDEPTDEPSDELTDEDEPEDEPATPQASGKVKLRSEWEMFYSGVIRARTLCENRDRLSQSIDSIGMRPLEAGSKLIPRGIPANALLDAMTMHWPDEARNEIGISKFDFVTFSSDVMKKRNITKPENGKEFHAMFGYVLLLAEARQPIFLVGPKGTGKSTLLSQLADYLEMPYGETAMSPGITRGDLLGRYTGSGMAQSQLLAGILNSIPSDSDELTEWKDEIVDAYRTGTLSGFIPAEFDTIYGQGGVFNFEEMDSADAGMLLVLNNALAGDKLYNSVKGAFVNRSRNFIATACANTLGLGANRQYTGREKLDAATLDRWNMGRVRIELDTRLERDYFTRVFEENMRSLNGN
jgi:energy-coupling factor transporter ATP-binding protein EcfA2